MTTLGDYATGKWLDPETATIDDDRKYLVQTNGMEWRDADLFVWPGVMVKHKMQPNIVRGRPIRIAAIVS